MPDSPAKRAVNHADKILDNRREVDPISADRANRIREITKQVANKTLEENGETTLRDWLEPLDLHFNPEEFIEHEPPITVTPEVIAVTVYLDQYPKTLGKYAHDEIHQKYMSPHTEMTQDEHFNMTEYVHRYY